MTRPSVSPPHSPDVAPPPFLFSAQCGTLEERLFTNRNTAGRTGC